jgi:hypothetical protein
MKSKTFSLVFLTALLVISTLALVSATFSLNTNTISFTNGISAINITITNTNASELLNIGTGTLSIGGENSYLVSFNSSTLSNINASQPQKVTIIPLTAIDYSKFKFGKTYTGSLLFLNTIKPSENQTITVNIDRSYCSDGNTYQFNTTKYIEITNFKDTSSENDWEWKPGDQVDVELKIRYYNTQDDSDSIDAVVNLELYDTDTGKFIEFDNQDDLEKSITLDEGETDAEEFTLEVPVSDIKDSSSRYRLYVKVYEDGRESRVCTDQINSNDYQQIEIQKNSYEVALKDLETNSPVPCGEDATIFLNAYNIGNNDEDKVYVKLYNKELGLINLTSEVFSLDQGDSKKINFDFIIPSTATAKTYDIQLIAYYRYSKSSDTYRESSPDPLLVPFKVDSCIKTSPAQISAELSSDTPRALIGNQVAILATIKNTGSSSATYTLDVAGNTEWSTLAEIDPKTITLNAGESKQAVIYLNINDDATLGDKEFLIRTSSSGVVSEQKVSLSLEKGFSSSAIINHIKANWLIYVIVLVNLILIIAIIIVVASILRKSNK